MQNWSEVTQHDLTEALKLMTLAQKHDKTHQTLLYNTLNTLQKDPRIYVCFLRIVLSSNVATELREVTGLTLKSMLKRNYDELPNEALNFIKTTLMQNFRQSQPRISKVVSVLLNVFVHEKGADIQIMEFLLDAISSTDENALRCLAIVLEDLKTGSENSSVFGSAHFNQLIEQFANALLRLCEGPQKVLAMHCFNSLLSLLPSHLDNIAQRYISLVEVELRGSNPDVLYRAMEALQILSEQRKELVRESTMRLVGQTSFGETRSRKLQFLFWIEVLDCQRTQEVCQFVPLLLPKCISALQFTAEDLANQMRASQPIEARYQDHTESTDPHDEEELLSDSDDKVEEGYTLRKMAGNLVSKMAVNFCEGLWELSRPIVQQLLLQNNWQSCEIGVLYIGLIAEFCKDQLTSNMFQIISSCSGLMAKFEEPQLVATCLWTLSQFTEEIVSLSRSDPALLENYLSTLLRYLESTYQNIKQAACSSIGKLVEVGRASISQAYPLIAGKLAELIRTQRSDTLVSLLMVVSLLGEHMPDELKTAETAQLLLKTLCEKWVSLSGTASVNQVIECLVDVVSSFQRFVQPYCSEIFQMAAKMFDASAKDLALRLSDLFIILLESDSPSLAQCVQTSDLPEKTVRMIQGDDKQLKQSCYSLLSNIVKHIGVPSPAQLISVVWGSCDRQSQLLTNNCLFCVLQIMSSYPVGREYAADMYELSMKFLDELTPAKKILQVNFSKVVGKLANLFPEHFAALLPKIGRCCFSGIKSEFRDAHMLTAYMGFFKLVTLNFNAVLPDFDSLVDSYLFFKAPTSETDAIFKKILQQYRATVGEAGWQSFLSRKLFLPATVKRISNYFI